MQAQPFKESNIQYAYRNIHIFYNHFMVSDAVCWLEGILRAATMPALFSLPQVIPYFFLNRFFNSLPCLPLQADGVFAFFCIIKVCHGKRNRN